MRLSGCPIELRGQEQAARSSDTAYLWLTYCNAGVRTPNALQLGWAAVVYDVSSMCVSWAALGQAIGVAPSVVCERRIIGLLERDVRA